MKRLLLMGVLFCLLLPAYGFAQPDRSDEVQKLMTGLESASRVQRVTSAKIITRSGLRDQALYQKVAELLKTGYAQAPESEHVDEMSWLCKALAASGDANYRELLDDVAANSSSVKLQRYAKQSSALIDQYAQRSQILNATDTWDNDLSSEENRLINMLGSDDNRLRKDAAKILVRNPGTDKKVFAAASSALTTMSKELRSDNESIDTMAWLCKALGASGDNQYVEVLEQVHAGTQSLKLRSYVSKSLNALK